MSNEFDTIHEITCPCCDLVLRISGFNLARFACAFAFAYPIGTPVDFPSVINSGVDWTAEVPDDVMARVAVRAGLPPTLRIR
jgi:hypothetical protein